MAGRPLTAFWPLDEEDPVQKGKAASEQHISEQELFSMLSAVPNLRLPLLPEAVGSETIPPRIHCQRCTTV
jgi:hypothetical protein